MRKTTIRCQKCGHENPKGILSMAGHCEKCEASLSYPPRKQEKPKSKFNEIERPDSVKWLAVVYTFLGIFWIFVSYFGIYKMKRWGLYFAIGMSLFWLIIWFAVYSTKPPTEPVSILLGSIIAWSMPIMTAYVYWKHIDKFKGTSLNPFDEQK